MTLTSRHQVMLTAVLPICKAIQPNGVTTARQHNHSYKELTQGSVPVTKLAKCLLHHYSKRLHMNYYLQITGLGLRVEGFRGLGFFRVWVLGV